MGRSDAKHSGMVIVVLRRNGSEESGKQEVGSAPPIPSFVLKYGGICRRLEEEGWSCAA